MLLGEEQDQRDTSASPDLFSSLPEDQEHLSSLKVFNEHNLLNVLTKIDIIIMILKLGMLLSPDRWQLIFRG